MNIEQLQRQKLELFAENISDYSEAMQKSFHLILMASENWRLSSSKDEEFANSLQDLRKMHQQIILNLSSIYYRNRQD